MSRNRRWLPKFVCSAKSSVANVRRFATRARKIVAKSAQRCVANVPMPARRAGNSTLSTITMWRTRFACATLKFWPAVFRLLGLCDASSYHSLTQARIVVRRRPVLNDGTSKWFNATLPWHTPLCRPQVACFLSLVWSLPHRLLCNRPSRTVRMKSRSILERRSSSRLTSPR